MQRRCVGIRETNPCTRHQTQIVVWHAVSVFLSEGLAEVQHRFDYIILRHLIVAIFPKILGVFDHIAEDTHKLESPNDCPVLSELSGVFKLITPPRLHELPEYRVVLAPRAVFCYHLHQQQRTGKRQAENLGSLTP